jgi:hypothetical protein
MAPRTNTRNTAQPESLNETPLQETLLQETEQPVHDQPEEELSLRDLLSAIEGFSHRLSRIESHLPDNTPATSTSSDDHHAPPKSDPRPAQIRDPKVNLPPEFSGKVADFRNFMSQCSLTFSMSPNTYVTDEQKVLFVISLLRGLALNFARDIPEDPDHPLRKDYPAFRLALNNLYGDRAFKAVSEDKLLSLRQTGSAATYAQEFQTLVAPLEYNDGAQCALFFQGLKSEVKRAILPIGRASPLHALIDQVVTLDQRLFQQSREDSKRHPTPFAPEYPANRQTNDTAANHPKPTYQSYPRGPLTDAEKERRRANNLCNYCGGAGHIANDCPNNKNNKSYVPRPAPPAAVSLLERSTTHTPIEYSYPVPVHPLTRSSSAPIPENWQSQNP